MKRRDIVTVWLLLASITVSTATYHTNSRFEGYSEIKVKSKTPKENLNDFMNVVKVEKQKRIEEEKQRQLEEQKKRELAELESRQVVYNSNNLTQPSNLTLEKARLALKGTSLESIANVFIKAEKETGVNGLFLMGLVANESAWGESDRARYQNNMTGYAVYSRTSRGGEFDSKEDNIIKTAKMLRDNYLNPNGIHYNGTSIRSVNVMYCQDGGQPNYHWTETINSISRNLRDKLNKGE